MIDTVLGEEFNRFLWRSMTTASIYFYPHTSAAYISNNRATFSLFEFNECSALEKTFSVLCGHHDCDELLIFKNSQYYILPALITKIGEIKN